jgi:hypothetical protein
LKHILDTRTGIVHYEWTNELGLFPMPYCQDEIATKEDYAHIVDTEDDITCTDCLHDVALYTDRTYNKGDLVLNDGMYCLVNDVDPTYALVQFECQDGSYIWDIPIGITRVTKENKPPLFWRMKRTPYKGKMKFWIGRNYGTTQGAFIVGEVHAYNGMSEASAIIECRRMLEGYVRQWHK